MSRAIEQPRRTAALAPPGSGLGRLAAGLERLVRRVARAWRHDPGGLVGLAITAGGILIAVFAPLLAPYDPDAQDILNSLVGPSWLAGGAPGHLLGTDQVGRDVLSRIIFGSRVSLSIGFLAVAISAPLGVTIGLVTAYYGGWLEDLMMRLADAQLAIPFLLLAIAIVAVLGPGLTNVILVLGLASWVVYARVVRAEVLSLKNKEFVEAARAIGATDARVIVCHILPNTLVPVSVIATFAVAHMILAESSLSFLGLGVPPPTPTWGGMVGDSRNYLTTAWWLPVFPGLAIALTVQGVNFLGDWLREALDPRRRN
jgi:peptide/nickel transport system permease protein